MHRGIVGALVMVAGLGALGCTSTHEGIDAGPSPADAGRCEPCQDVVQLRIMGVDDASQVFVTGAPDGIECVNAGAFVYCGIRDLAPGEYTLTVSADGFMPVDVFFTLEATITTPGCPTCLAPFTTLLTLRPE